MIFDTLHWGLGNPHIREDKLCEIPQGVTVKQQASGLLLNARGVKPLWEISALALIYF